MISTGEVGYDILPGQKSEQCGPYAGPHPSAEGNSLAARLDIPNPFDVFHNFINCAAILFLFHLKPPSCNAHLDDSVCFTCVLLCVLQCSHCCKYYRPGASPASYMHICEGQGCVLKAVMLPGLEICQPGILMPSLTHTQDTLSRHHCNTTVTHQLWCCCVSTVSWSPPERYSKCVQLLLETAARA